MELIKPENKNSNKIEKREFNFSSNKFKFSNHFLVNDLFCEMIKCINSKTPKSFINMSKYITELNDGKKVFFSKEMTKECFQLLKAFLKIKNYIQKQTLKYGKINQINQFNLLLQPFDKIYTIHIIKDCSSYVFDVKEIIKIYRYSLQNIDKHLYMTGNLLYPRNPYTNIPFTLKENIIIYEKIQDYYFSIKKNIPVYLINFKNCYFDIEKYLNFNFPFLMKSSIISYLSQLSDKNFKFEFNDMVGSSNIIKKSYCRYCFKKLNLKNIFLHTVALYILNSNSIFIFGNYINKFKKVSRENNLLSNLKHINNHRKKIRRPNLINFQNITSEN